MDKVQYIMMMEVFMMVISKMIKKLKDWGNYMMRLEMSLRIIICFLKAYKGFMFFIF